MATCARWPTGATVSGKSSGSASISGRSIITTGGSETTRVNGLITISFNEVPGKAVAVVFTGGCNFRCPWCQNRDLVLRPESMPVITEEDIFAAVEKRRKWLDGIAITGGEPTLQPDLKDFCGRVKEKGLQVSVATNGSNPRVLEDLIKSGLIDYISMDVKAPLTPERYRELTGVDDSAVFERVLESIELIRNSPVDYEFRTTLVPELLSPDDVVKIATYLRGARRYAIQQFAPHSTVDPRFEQMAPWPREAVERTRKAISGMFKSFEVRNI
ncbi:MAG: anaerobic ribonucleoside-triphosphate reductase activating protein [Candidatus Hadarchaeum sp.]